MQDIDTIQRFLFEHADIRGEMIHLEQVYQTIIQQRPYPSTIKKLLGEALLSAVLLAGSIKFEGNISIQFHGDKRLPLLLAQCNHQLQVRAVATYQDDDPSIDYSDAFLQGKMVINMTPFNQTQTYQSVVPIHSISMADNLMHYFAQSEQIPSQVYFAVSDQLAAGILLQLMPGQNSLQREQFWEYAVAIGQTITEQELLTLDNAAILHRLYHETELRLYSPRPIQFQCRCNIEKMKQVLTVLGEKEVNALLKEKGQIEVSCEFCNQVYVFDAIDITLLFINKDNS